VCVLWRRISLAARRSLVILGDARPAQMSDKESIRSGPHAYTALSGTSHRTPATAVRSSKSSNAGMRSISVLGRKIRKGGVPRFQDTELGAGGCRGPQSRAAFGNRRSLNGATTTLTLTAGINRYRCAR
jgi:hypothetical protein